MAVLTETNFNIAGEIPVTSVVVKAAQNDIIVLPHAGARNIQARLYTGTVEATTFAKLQIANTGTAYTTATKALVYDNGTANARPAGGFYCMTEDGEIIYVQNDSAPTGATGTLTVKRGCLGTTATSAAVANDKYLYVLCSLTLSTETTTGPVMIDYSPLPPDPNTKMYSA